MNEQWAATAVSGRRLGGDYRSLLTAFAVVSRLPAPQARSFAKDCWPTRRSCPDASMLCAMRNMAGAVANRAAIETPFASSWKGAAKPEVTLVEFFDYACPYCKASNPYVDRLLKEDPGLRVVYRELPILGPDSVTAHGYRSKPQAWPVRPVPRCFVVGRTPGGRYQRQGCRRGRNRPRAQAGPCDRG